MNSTGHQLLHLTLSRACSVIRTVRHHCSFRCLPTTIHPTSHAHLLLVLCIYPQARGLTRLERRDGSADLEEPSQTHGQQEDHTGAD